MPRKLKWKGIGEISLVDKGANFETAFPITKGKQMTIKAEMLEAALETPVDGEQEIAKRFETEDEKAAAVALYRVADAVNLRKAFDLPKPEVVEVVKGADPEPDKADEMDEEIRKQFETLQKQLDDANQELAKAKDEREYEGWLAKAKEELRYVPGELEDIAKQLHAVAKVDPGMAKSQFETLAKSSTAIEKSEAFAKVSTRGDQESDEDMFIEKRVKELESAGKSKLQALIEAGREARKNS